MPPGDERFVEETLEKHRGLMKSIKKTFEAVLGESKLQRRQSDGDDIDLDAVIEAYADVANGREMSEYLYTRYRNQERNIAVMFMVDMSGSTLGWVNDAERAFIDGDAPQAALMRSFQSLDYHAYAFDGGPYLGFPRSHDVWGDGSVVVVPAPGHTPGSVVVFLALPSGKRYALLGDLVWAMEGITLPAERPWLPRWLIGEDAAQVRENVTRLAAIHARYPEIELVPAHDMRALATLPHFPASGG